MQSISNMAGFVPLVPASRSGLNGKGSAADYGFEPPAAPTVLAQLATRGAALSISPTLAAQTLQTLMQTQELIVAPNQTPIKSEQELKEKGALKKRTRDRKHDAYNDEDSREEESDDAPQQEVPLPRTFVRARRRTS